MGSEAAGLAEGAQGEFDVPGVVLDKQDLDQPTPFAALFRAGKKGRDGAVQRLGEALDAFERGIAGAALDVGNVRAVEPSAVG